MFLDRPRCRLVLLMTSTKDRDMRTVQYLQAMSMHDAQYAHYFVCNCTSAVSLCLQPLGAQPRGMLARARARRALPFSTSLVSLNTIMRVVVLPVVKMRIGRLQMLWNKVLIGGGAGVTELLGRVLSSRSAVHKFEEARVEAYFERLDIKLKSGRTTSPFLYFCIHVKAAFQTLNTLHALNRGETVRPLIGRCGRTGKIHLSTQSPELLLLFLLPKQSSKQ